MRNLIICASAITAFLFALSCSPTKVKSQVSSPSNSVITIAPDFTKLTYNAEIHYFGTTHTGKFYIEKVIYDQKTHCVLLSDEGMKLFDLSFDQQDNFKIEYIDSSLDKEKFRTILEDDFKMLFKNTVKGSTPEYHRTDKDSINAEIFNIEKHHYKYFYNTRTNYANRIESSGLIGTDSYISLVQRPNGHPREIDIHHPKMTLRLLFVHEDK